jgi:RNA polymerase sigma factor (sigma-70 family)
MALPEKERLIVFLRYYADLDYDTIAASLGISAGTVGSALHSAHRSLRVHLSTEVIQ